MQNTKYTNRISLWKKTTKNGKTILTGNYTNSKGVQTNLVGFFKVIEPDSNKPSLVIYFADAEFNADYEREFCAYWGRVAKSGMKYYSGKVAFADDTYSSLFSNTDKKNNKSPDYTGNVRKNETTSMPFEI